jgi:S-adenosylmethionine synthetase
MAEPHLFSSESVTEGHPDKVADQISDGILDAILAGDPRGRVACETLVTTGLAFIAGEITTKTYVEIPSLVRSIIKDIGYTDAAFGFDYETCAVVTSIDAQSGDIAMGVDTGGAGDQGLMFGYACRDTKELMPLPIMLAHRICERLALLRKSGKLDYLRPDGKSQVTVEYQDGKAIRIDAVVVSTQHSPDVKLKTIREDVIEHILKPLLPKRLTDWKTLEKKIYVNPTGRFVNGGPKADTGLTGRKIIVDTYGGMGSHGGGALSGKDPSKVDRSACYAARWVAKNLVAADLCDRVEVQLAYAIGVAQPVSIMCDSMGTGAIPDAEMTRLVRKHFDLTPKGIIEALKLRRPIYRKTAAYGHFGREEATFTWEKTNRAKDLARGL